MLIKRSNVVMFGQCLVQTSECKLKDELGTVTAVWVLQGYKQLDVCNDCLEKKLQDGEWQEKNGKKKTKATAKKPQKKKKNSLLKDAKKSS